MPLEVYEHLVVGQLQCNCYLVGDPETEQAVVIDPGDQPDDILAAAERHGLRLVAAVATHAHFDHILAAGAIRERTGVPFYLHTDELPLLDAMRTGSLKYLGRELRPPPEVDRWCRDGDEIVAGGAHLGVIHTPGHSPGSISLLAEGDVVFSGDTLFAGSIGRTDFLGGDRERELASIRERLFPLGDMPVYPGHGPPTTIDREKIANPIVGAFAHLWLP